MPGWQPLSRFVVKWAGGASPKAKEGRGRSLCASATSVNTKLCFMLLQCDCTGTADSRDGERELGV